VKPTGQEGGTWSKGFGVLNLFDSNGAWNHSCSCVERNTETRGVAQQSDRGEITLDDEQKARWSDLHYQCTDHHARERYPCVAFSFAMRELKKRGNRDEKNVDLRNIADSAGNRIIGW
jgi:hypothetical protein